MKKNITLTFLLFITFCNSQIFESYPTTSVTIFQPSNFISFNNKMYYFARDASFNYSLYATDGTTGGNQLVFPLGFAFTTYPNDAKFNDYKIVHNNELYFIFNNTFYKTNGTSAGTVVLKSNFNNSKYLFSYNGKIYLIGADNVNGTELWQSDGTAIGTILFKNINTTPSTNAATGAGNGFNPNLNPHFTLFNNKMFFVANDGVTGYELWSTDGTTSGTELFKDIRLPAQEGTITTDYGFGAFNNSASISGYSFSPFKVVNGRMYFAANRMTNTIGSDYFPNDSYILYSTDGTVANTDFVNIAVPPNSGVGNAPYNFLYVTNNTIMGFSEYNNELYVSNARPARHPYVGVTNPGIYKINNTNPFYRVGDLYIPNAGANGVTDDAQYGAMYWFNNEFYFIGRNTTSSPTDNNYYLFKLNPQTETFTLLSTVVGASSNPSFNGYLLAKIVGNKFYYFKDASKDVFVTDGTVSGISQLARNSDATQTTLSDQNITSDVFSLGTIDNSLYFNAGIAFGQNALYRIFNSNLSDDSFYKVDFSIFPNPTLSDINLILSKAFENGNLKITSISGQTVFEKNNLIGTDFNFDVSYLNSGIYLLQLSDGKSIFNSKFIKK